MAQIMGWGAMLSGLVLSMMLGAMPAEVQIFGDDAKLEKIDLSELRDGETRTFGSGEDVAAPAPHRRQSRKIQL